MNRTLEIAGSVISDTSAAFVIAEIGHNHQGDVEVCKKMFKAAKESGADAVKLQKRDNKSLYTESFYNSPYNSENAFGSTYGEHREALELGWDEYVELKKYAEDLGLIFFATPFDIPSADFLERLGVPCYKIASGDLTNSILIEHVARFGKPMIISTGGSTLEQIGHTCDRVLPINPNLAILHCTAMYPITDEHEDKVNLKVIETMRHNFPDLVIGFSDHSNGILFATVAYAYGARIIEKHFTLKRTMKGTDHAFSLEPQGMSRLVSYIKRLHIGLGDGNKRLYDQEKPPIRKMGKMIVAARDIAAGEGISLEDLAFKSPADGLSPICTEKIIGRKLRISIKKDEPILFDHF